MLEPISKEDAQALLNVKKVDSSIMVDEVTEKLPLISVTKLPSGFKGYPEGTKISYEPLTLGELEALNSDDEPDLVRGVAMLLNAIHCNTLNSEDLYYWDVMYIGIQRKLTAFGDTHGIIYNQCPKCGNIIEKQFDYTELEFKELEVPDLPVITKINNEELEFNLLTIKDFLEINVEDGELGVYAKMIKNKPENESLALLNNCYGKDVNKIRYIDQKLNYGIKPFIVNCENVIKDNKGEHVCDTAVRMEVRSPFEVVFPESTDQGYFDSEIQYGRK